MNGNLLLGAVLAIILACGLFVTRPRAHDIYSDWAVPGHPSMSCCHDRDCVPTRAYMGDDGRWRAWHDGAWLTVPGAAVLPPDLAGDGRSHICVTPAGGVRCFSPAVTKG